MRNLIEMETPASATMQLVYRRSADVVCRSVGSEAVLVPIRNRVGDLDFVYTLSPVAARVWERLDGNATVGEIVALICAEFEVTPEVAAADIAELLEDLRGVALVSPER